ncbi:DNA polymerase III subunit gamma/tau [Sulfurovum riftiae]|uniref:DNA polymerase III subunit gamma/tau n=1 Tax=Sulfurovum riftiae TaxID=1630136 RepID=A0A151CFV8_9BACT|nr:DNA polymerase III subunit gamma/tau [Sulfurovum riftiae]KYJ86381.1 DNA polymerase III subunit gamma/tau [Sulfurovum riftiae]
MSLALARKYRPATFDDLIGQDSVSQTLSLALDGNRLSHAYLFSGLRGSGKTSTARIFAKALLCEEGTTSHPCGSCTHCVMAAENRHMDIIEMDAASNRGIDDIKDLIEHTKYKPSSARYKIFIIDEVHMLTTQAFNALLKTLEEPPDFVKFILATTDPLKLPATILSRTQHFRFKKIPQNLVLSHLEHIMNLEKVEYEKEALDIIARSGAGSLRDSLTLLDQAIVYSKNFVDLGTVTGMLGIIEPSLLEALLGDIVQKDTTKILEFIKLASDYEAEMILDELTLYLKELLLTGSGKLNPMIIERFFRVIAESKSLLALGSDGEFVLSLALFKMMEALEIKDIDTMIRGLEKELKGVEVSEIMVSTPVPDLSTPAEVITITEEDILPPKETESIQHSAFSVQKEEEVPETTAPSTESIQEEAKENSSSAKDHSEDSTRRVVSPTKEETVQNETQRIIENTVAQSTQQPTQEAVSSSTRESVASSPLNADKFRELVKKVYDRDYDLGSCFERNIEFESFTDNKLTWHSTAEEEDKKMLIQNWGLINMFVKDLFGYETKIVNIAKKKTDAPIPSTGSATVDPASSAPRSSVPEPAEGVEGRERVEEIKAVHNDTDSGSMIEDIEMKSSCIAPEAGETEAAKEKDPSTLLEEPMVKAAMELLNPKKVRIKRNT